MKLEGEGKLLRVFIGESDRAHGKPLYEVIVARAKEHGLAGATVLRGLEGYGAHSQVHTKKILTLSADLPIVVEIVDKEEAIESFIPVLDELVTEGMITIEKATIIAYRKRSSGTDSH